MRFVYFACVLLVVISCYLAYVVWFGVCFVLFVYLRLWYFSVLAFEFVVVVNSVVIAALVWVVVCN